MMSTAMLGQDAPALFSSATLVRSHFFDAALHRAITETGALDGRRILRSAAAAAASAAVLAWNEEASAEETVGELLVGLGCGRLMSYEANGSKISVRLGKSAIAAARLRMFGASKNGSCDLVAGVLSGALEATLGTPHDVQEVSCSASGDDECVFVGEPAPKQRTSPASRRVVLPFDPGIGSVTSPDSLEAGVLSPLLSADGPGLSGAHYGKIWPSVYARTAQDFEEELPQVMGPKFANLAAVVLTEAAHLATFHSIGALLRSAEWRGVVSPTLPSREAWASSIVSLLELLGWGRWRIRLLAPQQRLTVEVEGGFEANWAIANCGIGVGNRCYFTNGIVAAIMNLLYSGDILEPNELDGSIYNRFFRSPSSYRSIETRCRASGDPHCEFVANPLSTGLRSL